jgi:murein L,D-transpeptidase YafK
MHVDEPLSYRRGAQRLRTRVRSALTLAALAVALPMLLLSPSIAPARGEELLLKADRVVVLKSRRELLLMRNGEVLKSFPIALGAHPRGPKQQRGDGRTPEGLYVVDGRNPRSAYHRSLHLSYPNETDRARARAAGVDPGNDIVIHGMPNRYGRFDPVRFFRDWTDGCIAVGSTAIEEIWARVDDGTPVEIGP